MAFKSSVNIKFDIGNAEFIERYIPTPSHAEAMKGIIEGFTEENANKAHIIVGPYGTGKSLLANIVSSIVSKLISASDISKLVKKFENVDDQITSKIKAASNLPVSYLPIILSGNEGRFRNVIISNILRKLQDRGIEVVLPGLVTKIIESINVWKKEYPSTYENFKFLLEKEEKKLDKWIEEIKKQNESEIKYFSKIYPLLTAGASFDIDYGNSFLEQIEYLSIILNKHKLGIFIVHDEFARFLQGLNTSKFNEAMQDIQDLAEFVSRAKTIHFLLITHKSLHHYFNTYSNESAKEFQRIEKRFNKYFVNSDQATFLRVAEMMLTENISKKPKISSADFIRTQALMRKYPLFPSINQTERDELVIQGMFPLHPVSIFLLPSLTRVFGQNERTLFTFLESQETGGLLNHINKTDSYYLVHQLFDFFFPESTINNSEDVSEYAVLYKKAVARIPKEILNKHSVMNLIKTITLWNLCAMQSEQKLTTEFLQFATQIDADELVDILSILSKNKVVRFNRINNYWELFAGNAIDLYEKLEQEKELLKKDKNKEIETLKYHLSKKYYFPERYNDVKGMTRYAMVRLVYGQDILDNKLKDEEQSSADLTIYYILPEDLTVRQSLELVLMEFSRQTNDTLYYLHSKPLEEVIPDIYNYIGLDFLKNNKSLLAEDKGIKEEIEILINETKYRISKYLFEIAEFNEEPLWYINGHRLSILSEIELTDLLSEKCNDLYSHTPVIFNDSYNRNTISGVQRKAAISLIDRILFEPQSDQFGITGTGPEYAIFASVLKNNGRLDQNINKLDYSNIVNESFRILRSELIGKLRKNPSGNFKDLIDLFTSPPFGIRKPLIPLLFVALLRDRWNEFMLYRNEMFVPGIDGAKLFNIIVEAGPENYWYVFENINQDYMDFFDKIEVHYKESIETRLYNHSRLIFICGTLLKWYRSLPRITQVSEQVVKEFSLFRDWIKRSEIDPQQSIAQIYKKYHYDFDGMVYIKRYAEDFIFIFKNNLVNKIFEVIGVTDIDDLKRWAKDHKLNNKLILKLTASFESTSTESWIDRFAEDYIGVKISDWSDATYDLFVSQLQYDFVQTISNKLEAPQSQENLVEIQLNNSRKRLYKVDLSVKSTTIYTNIERIINAAGRNVPRQELEYLIYKLFEDYVIKAE